MIRSVGYLLALFLGIIIAFNIVCPLSALQTVFYPPLELILIGFTALLFVDASRFRQMMPLEKIMIATYGAVIPVALFFSSAYWFFLYYTTKGFFFSPLATFQTGKIGLTPFVLWAASAFLRARVLKPDQPDQPTWVKLGLFAGAIVSVGNLIPLAIMLICGGWFFMFLMPFPFIPSFIIPVYTAIWYVQLSGKYCTSSNTPTNARKYTALSTIPFWIGSLIWSYNHYIKLPDDAVGCFIVTAAAKGHPSLVGPSSLIDVNGVPRRANPQLATFWTFEAWWSKRHPASHRRFRRIYNRIGPIIAAQIKSPYLADAVYLALKPAEVLAAFVIRNRKAT